MPKQIHRFTKEEDKVILSNAKKSCINLTKSFQKSAKELGLKEAQVRRRYYYIYKKNYCFLTVSENKAYVNKKIVRDNETTNEVIINKSFIKKWYINIIKLFSKYNY